MRIHVGYDSLGRRIYLTFKHNPHLHIIGSTRTGKSKLIEWIIRQLINSGIGFCLIDPHGQLYEDIVKWCAYHNLLDKKIVLLNVSEGDYIKGFNPFRKLDGDLSVQIDSQIMTIIKAWGAENTDQTPSMEGWLANDLQVVAESEQTILATRYLIDFYGQEVREYLTSFLSSNTLASELAYNDWKGASTAKTPKQFYLDNYILSTRNRLLRFLRSQQICRFMGLKDNNIDIEEIVEQGKILLVNLQPSKNLSRQNSHLFGALLVNEFFEYMSRRRKDFYGKPFNPFFLCIDEFQNFVKTPDIADMLDQLGKYGLHLILAHQRLGQIEQGQEDNLIDAIFTNIKNRAIFGGLTRQATKYVVENCFYGESKLDLTQIKKAIYQIKFWPVYGRDKAYSSSHGYSFGGSRSVVSASGTATHKASSGEGWFDFLTEPTILSTTDSGSGASGEVDSEAEMASEGEIDMPIFYPVPYYELTSAETWSLEEHIWNMSEALMAQLLRHCFMEIPGQKIQPMLVPFVKEFPIFEDTYKEYLMRLYEIEKERHSKIVDELIVQGLKELEQAAQVYAIQEASGDLVEPPTFREPAKAATKKRSDAS